MILYLSKASRDLKRRRSTGPEKEVERRDTESEAEKERENRTEQVGESYGLSCRIGAE